MRAAPKEGRPTTRDDEYPRSLVFRQGQEEKWMASGRARREGQSNPDMKHQDGVETGGKLPPPGDVRVGEARAENIGDNSGV